MFKQLRNRFLILNLSIISVMMLMAFAAIYIITYQNVQKSINSELSDTTGFYSKSDNMKANHMHGINEMFGRGRMNRNGRLSERSVSFSLVLDSQGAIVSKESSFTIEDDFASRAIAAAHLGSSNTGTFSLDGDSWAFTAYTVDTGRRIVFVDVTSEKKILTHMINTFLIVTVVMLIVIYFVSRFFAARSINPIETAFNNQKQFIADASHELKTPLTVINTNVDVLLSYGDETINSQSKWLHYIKSESERMAKLTGDLLYLTQMDSEDSLRAQKHRDSDKVFRSLNLSETVENGILTMEAVFFEHELQLDYSISPDLWIHGSAEQLQEVLMILLDNALKYTNPGGHITVSLERRMGTAHLLVENTGDGISPEHIDKIFDRFYRTDKSRTRSSGGYGLGLSIAKTIIQHHKGKIYVESSPGRNTVFHVELRLAA